MVLFESILVRILKEIHTFFSLGHWMMTLVSLDSFI